jgi:hypothetical protein
MKELKFPSDHRPVKISINIDRNTLVLAFWNVSDPIYWSKFYPTALEGYELDDLKKEYDRLESILQWVDYLLENCDMLGLAEVPVRLISDLQVIAKKYNMRMDHISEHSDIWRPNEPISQMVVMYR